MIRISTLAAAAVVALGFSSNLAPAVAMPAVPGAVAAPAAEVVPVQMTRREMRRTKMNRGRMLSRRAARQRDSINARNPSRPVMQQQQGGTTGGPAR